MVNNGTTYRRHPKISIDGGVDMNIEHVLEQLDSLFANHRIGDVEDFLTEKWRKRPEKGTGVRLSP